MPMPGNMQSQSFQHADTQNQQSEEIIRQDYGVQVSCGQKYLIPNAFGDVDLPLIKIHKPDYSRAVEMAVGVRDVFSQGCAIFSCF